MNTSSTPNVQYAYSQMAGGAREVSSRDGTGRIEVGPGIVAVLDRVAGYAVHDGANAPVKDIVNVMGLVEQIAG